MRLLGRLRLRTKLIALTMLSALALIAMTGVSASIIHQRMMNDRIDKLRSLVLTARGFADFLEQQVKAGTLTREQAMAEFRRELHHVRYGSKSDYFLAQTYDGLVVMHGGDARREGKPTTAHDDQGRSSAQLAAIALRHADGGVIHYSVAKPGHAQKAQKISYVARYAPWKLDFITGSWVGDIDHAYNMVLERLVGLAVLVLLIGGLAAWLINRDITGSLGRLRAAMAQLADGDPDTPIPGLDRQDEVHDMAGAVQVFKHNAQEMRRLTQEREQSEQRMREEKRRDMARLADTFEAQAGAAVQEVASAARRMEVTAESMTSSAERSNRRATAVVAASEQASANVQAVASAAEQLSGSVSEISRQVATSSEIASQAARDSEHTNMLVNSLADAARQIGTVTEMINEIANKTNLLALNATIEAARAGEAGKGFAVVASEVKSLANQTAKATQEITGQISTMQNATGQTVTAIQSIGTTISRLNEIAATIASAVEQQGAATQEIARNVQQAAAGTTEVSGNIAEVSAVIGETSTAATQVVDAAGALSGQSKLLRSQVDSFLAAVRAAA